MDHYDVIVIGTGAGGGTLANALAFAGRRVLMVERGGFVPREPQNWSAREVFVNGRYVSADTWRDSRGRPFQPGAHYNVGGATKFYGAALYRLRPHDFTALAHADGLSPEWPIGYADLEPYYTAAEHMYQVHGAHGEDPTEGPWSHQYPYSAVRHEARIAEISGILAGKGYHPFHAPCGVMLNEQLPLLSACRKCATCDGFPCMVGAKSDAEVIAVRPAMALPNVTLLTNAEARRLITDQSGRTVTGVVVTRDGQEETYTGDVVVVAAGAANTARLLLMSASESHPNGLANGSDQVGRNYMCHVSRAVLAIDAEPNRTRFQKTLGINDFYFAGEYSRWPLGNIQMVGKSTADAMRGESALARMAPGWPLAKVAAHAVDFWLTTEDLPLPGNRVTVDRAGRITLAYRHTNAVEARELYGRLRAMMGHIGIRAHRVIPTAYAGKSVGLSAVAHQAGTARMGYDRETSVLRPDCRAWDVSNLYVADASVFPSIGAVNPALTVMANALRVAGVIDARLGK
jgi:choline dehydrogenase-like flavoprotein